MAQWQSKWKYDSWMEKIKYSIREKHRQQQQPYREWNNSNQNEQNCIYFCGKLPIKLQPPRMRVCWLTGLLFFIQVDAAVVAAAFGVTVPISPLDTFSTHFFHFISISFIFAVFRCRCTQVLQSVLSVKIEAIYHHEVSTVRSKSTQH